MDDSHFIRSADRPPNRSGPSLSSITSDGGLSFLNGGIRPPTPSYDWTKGADPRHPHCGFRPLVRDFYSRGERTTRRQHAANMLSSGQGSPDPVRSHHAHWATCDVGEAAPAFFLAGEAIETGVTVVWGGHWGGHPPPDQDDPAHHTPHPPAPKSCHQFAGM